MKPPKTCDVPYAKKTLLMLGASVLFLALPTAAQSQNNLEDPMFISGGDVVFFGDNANIIGTITNEGTLRFHQNAQFMGGSVVQQGGGVTVFDDGAIVLGATLDSHVSGYVRKIGDDPFVFPVGDGTLYKPVGSSAPPLASSTVTAAYFLGDPAVGQETFIAGNAIADPMGISAGDVVYFDEGVTIGATIANEGTLQFARGLHFQTGLILQSGSGLTILNNNAIALGTTDATHVAGYVRKVGDDAFVFPIGDGLQYRPVALSAPSSAATTQTAAYFRVDPNAAVEPAGAPFSTAQLSDLQGVSNSEYWDIEGSEAVEITLYWNPSSNLSAVSPDLGTIVVAGWDGSQWVNLGSSERLGDLNGTGTVTSSAAIIPSDYTAFTFGRATGQPGLTALVDLYRGEYWDIDGTDPVEITLYWTASTGLTSTLTDPDQLVVAAWDGDTWTSLGASSMTGTLAGGGTVTSDPVVPSNYVAFTFGRAVDLLADDDGDGIPNVVEGNGDVDGDGILNFLDIESDGDQILDIVEDTTGTNPYNVDTDGDERCDGPISVVGICANGEDINFDGVVDPGETDPREADTDGDGLDDGNELVRAAPTDPLNPDSDSDGLCDGPGAVMMVCVAGEDLNANGIVDLTETDPNDEDTDDGGIGDGAERLFGTDPLVGADDMFNDDDGDGLDNTEEIILGTDPAVADTDGDGLNDGIELLGGNPTNPLNPDTDGDFLCDGASAVPMICASGEDINANGLVDLGETDPNIADSDGNGVDDGDETLDVTLVALCDELETELFATYPLGQLGRTESELAVTMCNNGLACYQNMDADLSGCHLRSLSAVHKQLLNIERDFGDDVHLDLRREVANAGLVSVNQFKNRYKADPEDEDSLIQGTALFDEAVALYESNDITSNVIAKLDDAFFFIDNARRNYPSVGSSSNVACSALDQFRQEVEEYSNLVGVTGAASLSSIATDLDFAHSIQCQGLSPAEDCFDASILRGLISLMNTAGDLRNFGLDIEQDEFLVWTRNWRLGLSRVAQSWITQSLSALNAWRLANGLHPNYDPATITTAQQNWLDAEVILESGDIDLFLFRFSDISARCLLLDSYEIVNDWWADLENPGCGFAIPYQRPAACPAWPLHP